MSPYTIHRTFPLQTEREHVKSEWVIVYLMTEDGEELHRIDLCMN